MCTDSAKELNLLDLVKRGNQIQIISGDVPGQGHGQEPPKQEQCSGTCENCVRRQIAAGQGRGG